MKRETIRAAQAFADYLAMGTGRSLEKLLDRYQIATSLPPTRRLMTLKGWSTAFGWQARLDEIINQECQAVISRGIADRQNRIDALNERWAKMQKVIRDRAADFTMASASGADTGLLVRTYKSAGSGLPMLEEYAVDTGLLKEMRAHEEQAAKELGQWADKSELTGAGGGPVAIRVKADELSDDQLDAFLSGCQDRKGFPSGKAKPD